MATIVAQTGTFNISTHNPYISGYVQWRETYDNSTYIDTNKTKVEMKAYLHRTNIYDGATYITNTPVTRIMHFGNEQLSDEGSVSFSIPGNTSSSGGEYIAVYAATKEITHDADGSKSLSLGFHMWNDETGVAGDSFRVNTTRQTVKLTTIPRASTIGTVTGNTIGSSCTVNITRASSSFTHQLWYKVGNSGWYDLGKGIGASKTFTIDIATANQFTTTSSGTMQLCVRTFNGTTQVGSDVYKDVTVYVPNYTPDSSLGVQITGNKLLDGVYVEGKSFLSVYIQATTDYGASIVSYSSTIDGEYYSGDLFDTAPLSKGTHRVTTTIKDSRGKTTTVYSNYITVEEYKSPTITSLQAKRDDSDSSKVIVTVKGYVSPINNKNTIKKAEVTLDGVTKAISMSGYTFNDTITFTSVDTDNTLTATATVTDIYSSTSFDSTLSTVAVTMDFYNTGKGIAIGKVAESDGLEVDWDANFNKKVSVDGVSTFNKSVKFNSISVDTVSFDAKDNIDSEAGFALKKGNTIYGYVFMDEKDGHLKRYTSGFAERVIIDQENIGDYLGTAPADYVVETGGGGLIGNEYVYRKWNSGFAEYFGYYTVNVNISTAWGSWYASPAIVFPSFPFTFSGAPDVHISWESDFSAIVDGVGKRESTKAGQTYLYRPVAQTNVNGRFSIYAYGKWK